MGKPMSGTRLRRIGQVLFIVGGLCVVFRLAIARFLVEWLRPPIPVYVTGPMQHPVARYELIACLVGFGFILVAGIVGVVAFMRGRE